MTANGTEEDVASTFNHFTNFALLVDIRTRVEGKATEDVGLEVLTYIGAVFSMIGTLITTFAMLKFKKIRSRVSSKFHAQLCISLFLMLLIFLVGIERTENEVLCTMMSLLIQYFALAAVMWMGAEAVLLFQQLIIVFGIITTKYIVVGSLVCWVTPLIFTVVSLATLGTGKNTLVNSRREENGTSGEDAILRFCFIGDLGVFLGIFLVPIILIMIMNVVIFACLIRVLIRHAKRKRRDDKKDWQILKVIRNFTFITFLLGLPWLFGALTISKASRTFQYLFIITNAFQGFYLFLFLYVLNDDVRKESIDFIKRIIARRIYDIELTSVTSPIATDLNSSYKVDTLVGSTDISNESATY